MALILAIPISTTGVNATYWKITEKYEDILNSVVKLKLAGFLDQETRETPGSVPLISKDGLLDGDLYAPDMTRAQAYAALKQTADFSAATDDI